MIRIFSMQKVPISLCGLRISSTFFASSLSNCLKYFIFNFIAYLRRDVGPYNELNDHSIKINSVMNPLLISFSRTKFSLSTAFTTLSSESALFLLPAFFFKNKIGLNRLLSNEIRVLFSIRLSVRQNFQSLREKRPRLSVR